MPQQHYHNSGPYRLEGESPSTRGDIFAAGVILHQLLTASLPDWDEVNLLPDERFQALPKELQELVIRMIGDKRGPLDANLDHIIKEMEIILGTCDRTAFLDDKTTFLEEETQVETTVDDKKKKSVLGRLLLFFLFLAIINAGVAAYLVYTGDIALDATTVERVEDWLWDRWDTVLTYWEDFLEYAEDLRADLPDKIRELNLERFLPKK